MLAAIMPLASSPMSEKGASQLKNHARQVQRTIESFAPWRRRKIAGRRKGEPLASGEVVVVLEPGETANHPLYEGAKIAHRE